MQFHCLISEYTGMPDISAISPVFDRRGERWKLVHTAVWPYNRVAYILIVGTLRAFLLMMLCGEAVQCALPQSEERRRARLCDVLQAYGWCVCAVLSALDLMRAPLCALCTRTISASHCYVLWSCSHYEARDKMPQPPLFVGIDGALTKRRRSRALAWAGAEEYNNNWSTLRPCVCPCAFHDGRVQPARMCYKQQDRKNVPTYVVLDAECWISAAWIRTARFKWKNICTYYC